MRFDAKNLEALVRRDPAGRGLATARDAVGNLWCEGALARAAAHLAEHGSRVLVVTGFAVVLDDRVTAETDGPPGALFLAALLDAAGIGATLATDRYAAPLLRAGLAVAGLPAERLIVFPQPRNDAAARQAVAAWRNEHCASASSFSHVVFIERVGPSHTAESVLRGVSPAQRSVAAAAFETAVPSQRRDVCHNMRGESVDAVTAPLHMLLPTERPSLVGVAPPRTIGIVDGGNEIGCGAVPWLALRDAIGRGPGAQIACRCATDETILAGVSNWGAYALAAATALLRAPRFAAAARVLADWTADRHRELLAALVAAGAVDGVTRRAEPTVDGLAADDYLDHFQRIKAAAEAGS